MVIWAAVALGSKWRACGSGLMGFLGFSAGLDRIL